jgi:hypothetical protein
MRIESSCKSFGKERTIVERPYHTLCQPEHHYGDGVQRMSQQSGNNGDTVRDQESSNRILRRVLPPTDTRLVSGNIRHPSRKPCIRTGGAASNSPGLPTGRISLRDVQRDPISTLFRATAINPARTVEVPTGPRRATGEFAAWDLHQCVAGMPDVVACYHCQFVTKVCAV